MAISRNERRKASKLRKARAACDAINTKAVMDRTDIVRRNLSSPHRPGKSLTRSCLADIAGMSHRGYVCSNVNRK